MENAFIRSSANAADYLVLTDPLMHIVWVNEAFTNKTGYTAEECRDKRWPDFLRGPDSNPIAERQILRRLRENKSVQAEFLRYTKAGVPFMENVQITPVYHHRGDLSGFICAGFDLNERKHTMEGVNKLLGNLFGLVELAKSESAGNLTIQTETISLLSKQMEDVAREMSRALTRLNIIPGPQESDEPDTFSEVWIIDDDQVISYITKRLIKTIDPNIQVHEFLSSKLALENIRIKGARGALILLDINMPGFSGWDFLDALTGMNTVAKVYMYSSSIDPDDVKRSRSYPMVVDFLCKPLDIKTLRALIDQNTQVRKVS